MEIWMLVISVGNLIVSMLLMVIIGVIYKKMDKSELT